jgi:hypothetical protein
MCLCKHCMLQMDDKGSVCAMAGVLGGKLGSVFGR